MEELSIPAARDIRRRGDKIQKNLRRGKNNSIAGTVCQRKILGGKTTCRLLQWPLVQTSYFKTGF
jgi:hypothetical protein